MARAVNEQAAGHPVVGWGLRACGAAAVALGLLGFIGDGAPTAGAVAAATLKTLQLFVLNVSPGELPNSAAWVAAFLAPLATIGAAVSSIAALRKSLGDRLRIWRLHRRPARDVFLGGGVTAAALAARRLQRPAATSPEVIGLDLRAESALERTLRTTLGRCYVVRGDALTTKALREVSVAAARHVWIVSGDDHRNLAIAKQVLMLPRDRRVERPPQILVNLLNRQLIRAHRAILGNLLDGSDVEFFSMSRLAARLLLTNYPPSVDDPTRVHIAILGASHLAAALVVHAAQHCVYSEDPACCVRITLVGAGSEALLKRLYRQFPALNPDSARVAGLDDLLPVARVQVHECDDAELTLGAWQDLQRIDPFSAVYVCAELDVDTMIAATRVAALRDVSPISAPPIVACVQQPGVDSLAANVNAMRIARYRIFDVYSECVQPHDAYPGAAADARAVLVNETYLGADVDDVAPELVRERAQAAWATLPDEFRWSSRLSADHVDIKLRLLGIADSETRSDEDRAILVEKLLRDPTSGALERMKRLEHRRFVAERLLDGWLPIAPQRTGALAPSGLARKEQKAILRLNHTLVPFDRLPEIDQNVDQQARDEQIVLSIPRFLRATKATR